MTRRDATRCLVWIALLVPIGAGSGCAREPDVVIYCSVDDHQARPVIAAFERETGLTVGFVGDVEARKTTGLVERLRLERNHPRADVFWSSELFQTIALAGEGLLASHESDVTRAWPQQHRDAEGLWFGFAARPRVIAFAPGRVSVDQRPTAWTDLTRDYLRGRIVMADPRFGTTGGHLGAMKAWWDRQAMPGYYAAFLEGLRANEVRLLPSGNAGVVQAIIDGSADLGPTDLDDVRVAIDAGHDIDFVLPDHNHEDESGNGTLLIPNTVAIVAGAPRRAAAERLVDFLLSEDVERMLAESTSGNVPLGPGRAAMAVVEVVDPLRFNPRRAAAERAAAVRMAIELLAQ